MALDRWQRVRQIFEQALEKSAGERAAFLQRECAGDDELRARIEALLAADAAASGFTDLLDSRVIAGVGDRFTPGAGTRVGSYRLQRVLASGGMGTVYEATQEHPRRTVALKVMREGISSQGMLRRFEYESEILARLRHPGIAQVFEAGTHLESRGGEQLGIPFFAMELIEEARTILDWAREKHLAIHERLLLFIK